MKKTKMIATISITAVTLFCAGIVTSAIATTDTNQNQEYVYQENDISAFSEFSSNPEEDDLKKQLVEENKDNSENDKTEYVDNDLALDEINEIEFNAEEQESNKNDLKAYEILSKYKGSEYARTDFITDYELDLSYMREMVKLIESGKLPKLEEDVLHKYVSRRAYWITDESVSAEFEKWMLG